MFVMRLFNSSVFCAISLVAETMSDFALDIVLSILAISSMSLFFCFSNSLIAGLSTTDFIASLTNFFELHHFGHGYEGHHLQFLHDLVPHIYGTPGIHLSIYLITSIVAGRPVISDTIFAIFAFLSIISFSKL
jgi:hypothetical protein